MAATAEKNVGRFKVEIELANNDDMAAVRRGYLAPDKVRRVKIVGVVDSGAANLVLPSAIAKQLGIPATDKVKVKYANGSVARRDKVEGVHLELQGRHGLFSATLEPKRDTALIGAIVLEELDFLVDCKKGKLYPRDPNYVLSEAE
jgi:predicted aspartyl protease